MKFNWESNTRTKRKQRTGFADVEIQVAAYRVRKTAGHELLDGEFSSMPADGEILGHGLVPLKHSRVDDYHEDRD